MIDLRRIRRIVRDKEVTEYAIRTEKGYIPVVVKTAFKVETFPDIIDDKEVTISIRGEVEFV